MLRARAPPFWAWAFGGQSIGLGTRVGKHPHNSMTQDPVQGVVGTQMYRSQNLLGNAVPPSRTPLPLLGGVTACDERLPHLKYRHGNLWPGTSGPGGLRLSDQEETWSGKEAPSPHAALSQEHLPAPFGSTVGRRGWEGGFSVSWVSFRDTRGKAPAGHEGALRAHRRALCL